MGSVTLKLLQPAEGTVVTLGAWPVRSEPVQLRAFLFDGEEDVSRRATFKWVLSWHGTYYTYTRVLATKPAASVRFDTGGDLLWVTASYKGTRHRANVRIRVLGENPSRGQVAKKIGPNDLLRALCWQESREWRQFDPGGTPLRPRRGRLVGSARGIAQILEKTWGRTTEIEKNDYARIAWQWDYCVDAARDILRYLAKKAQKRFPHEGENAIANRVVKAYHLGEGSFNSSEDPADFDYVKSVRRFMLDKPWSR
jgi:hypothetical protein